MRENFLPLIRTRLSSHYGELRDVFHVSRLAVFGSVARGEDRENSDIDVLVEFSRAVGWEIFDLNDYLEQLLQRKVDIATLAALKPELREQILSEKIELYSS
jgi:uncharacterized protein